MLIIYSNADKVLKNDLRSSVDSLKKTVSLYYLILFIYSLLNNFPRIFLVLSTEVYGRCKVFMFNNERFTLIKI